MMLPDKSALSDRELVAHLASLCLDESRVKADIVAYLVEVEDRRLHLRMACKSMFDFCVNRLNMSPNVANHRIAASRLVQRHSCLRDAVARGDLSLCTLVLLKNHVTAENAEALLAEIRGMSFRDVEQHLVARAPRPDIPESIAPVAEQAVLTVSSGPGSSSSPPASPAARVTQLAPARFAVQLTVSKEVRDKLERARDLMRHRNPDGGLDVVVERALDALLAVLEKEIFGTTKHPRSGAVGDASSGDVSAAARREVFERDGERCTYKDGEGNRCTARGFLEIDHIEARALGGSGAVPNLRVLCRPQNRLHAEEVFTRPHVDRAIARRCAKSAVAPSAFVAEAPVPTEAEPPHGGVEEEVETVEAVEAVVEAVVEAGVDTEVDAGVEAEVEVVEPRVGGVAYLERSGCGAVERHDEERARLLGGLTGLGFKRGEAVRALDAVLERAARSAGSRPLPELLRDAIGLLT